MVAAAAAMVARSWPGSQPVTPSYEYSSSGSLIAAAVVASCERSQSSHGLRGARSSAHPSQRNDHTSERATTMATALLQPASQPASQQPASAVNSSHGCLLCTAIVLLVAASAFPVSLHSLYIQTLYCIPRTTPRSCTSGWSSAIHF